MPYADTEQSRNGYAYQHYIVWWFFHDAPNRIIMEWELGGEWFDGLEHTEGQQLRQVAIDRPEYDPGAVSRCYCLETKYGYDTLFHYDAEEKRWDTRVRFIFERDFGGELERQWGVVGPLYPDVGLVWIFSSRIVREHFDAEIRTRFGSEQVSSVYRVY